MTVPLSMFPPGSIAQRADRLKSFHLTDRLYRRYYPAMSDFDHPALYPLNLPAQAEAQLDAYMILKPAEKAFVDAYLASMGESAKAAGVALIDQLKKAPFPVDPTSRAKAMLQTPRVQAAIHQRAREICARFEVDQNALIKEIANIAFSNMAHYGAIDNDGIPYFDFSTVTFAQMSAIKTLTVEELEPSALERQLAQLEDRSPTPRRKIKVELHSKLDAAEKLMKFLQMYAPEQVNVNINVKAQIATTNMTDQQLADIWAEKLKVVG